MVTLIKNYIDKVREKPEPKRKTLLFLWSSGITLLVAFLWFVNFNYVIYNKNLEEAEILAKAEKALKEGQVEMVSAEDKTEEKKIVWSSFLKNNVAAVAEGFKVLTGQMDE